MAEIFHPLTSGVNPAVGTSTASTAIPAAAPHVRLYNSGPNNVSVRWGVGAQSAVAADMVIPAGVIAYFQKNQADTIAYIATAAGSNLSIVAGEVL